MKIVGIGGGSGSGKSTLAHGLKENFPAINLIHLDDYQKKKKDTPIYNGFRNRDHPDSINFERLICDLEKLRSGQKVHSMTWRMHLDQNDTVDDKVPYVVYPSSIIVLEGYMTLLKEEIRNHLDYSVFLDLDFATRISRRNKSNPGDYLTKVLLPMHELYVEPTKVYAMITIDVNGKSKEEVLEEVVSGLCEGGML